MWGRGLVLILLAAGAIAGGITIADRAAAQQPSERVVVTPAEGTAFTIFRFIGSGFTAWPQVSVIFIGPDGVSRRLRDDQGREHHVWFTRPDGSFDIDLVPGLRFQAAPPGRWTALFCGLIPPAASDAPVQPALAIAASDAAAAQTIPAPTCQRLSFDVLPAAPR